MVKQLQYKYSLGIFQLRKLIDFVAKVSWNHFFEPESKMWAQFKKDYLL